MKLEQMSLTELAALKANVEEAINKRRETDRHEAIAKLEAVAAEAGYSLQELLGTPRARREVPAPHNQDKRASVDPKYRNPNDHTETWSGRGRKPKWMETAIASGHTLDQLRIVES